MRKEAINIFVSPKEGCFMPQEVGEDNCIISKSGGEIMASFEVEDVYFERPHLLTKVAKCYFENNIGSKEVSFELKDKDTNKVMNISEFNPGNYNLEGHVVFEEDDLPEGKRIEDIESVQFYI